MNVSKFDKKNVTLYIVLRNKKLGTASAHNKIFYNLSFLEPQLLFETEM